jgi:adenine-specific DNA-methyltransferase
VKADEIFADESGLPLVEHRLFLLDPRLPEQEICKRYPALWAYLEEGKARGLHERYLCRHRSLWYGQENRPAAPIVCTYLGRGDAKTGRPFRFILNHSQATVANVYLAMYPTPIMARALEREPGMIRRAWDGGGLHKLEPKELANVPVTELADLMRSDDSFTGQSDLFVDEAA